MVLGDVFPLTKTFLGGFDPTRCFLRRKLETPKTKVTNRTTAPHNHVTQPQNQPIKSRYISERQHAEEYHGTINMLRNSMEKSELSGHRAHGWSSSFDVSAWLRWVFVGPHLLSRWRNELDGFKLRAGGFNEKSPVPKKLDLDDT